MHTNSSIGCNVTECKHHAGNTNLCTLDHIEVIKHAQKADCPECTDCGSFVKS
ncbi:MAG: DUF1540 domain-containing protein [Anaeromicrobium sp.]|jgi:hypothetical protein|uniref:DUF1540 domain-containing protein n=1 Tax=Anaeromicrobium sp. TaxID=1929132 RepID=UPI0025FD768F|nr:DUF1540 domain-containing protein [Anaeromicrobium sp.]MCT4593639.1 DUF1540 domain-containing protein [Anaeromicrobium sp.]